MVEMMVAKCIPAIVNACAENLLKQQEMGNYQYAIGKSYSAALKSKDSIETKLVKVVDCTSLASSASAPSSTPSAFQHPSGISEEHDRNRKRNNLILFGMPEFAESAPEDQLLDDCKSFQSLLHDKFKFAKGDIINAFRIGSKSNDKDWPFLIKFATEQMKWDILKVSKNMKLLKGDISYAVYFSLDRTALQCKERQCLLDELRVRMNNGESDLIITDNKIVNKSEVFFQSSAQAIWAQLLDE